MAPAGSRRPAGAILFGIPVPLRGTVSCLVSHPRFWCFLFCLGGHDRCALVYMGRRSRQLGECKMQNQDWKCKILLKVSTSPACLGLIRHPNARIRATFAERTAT